MKKVLVVACAASVFALISNANAQTTTADIQVTGTVDKACVITNTPGNITLGSISTAVGGVLQKGSTSAVSTSANYACSAKLKATNGKLVGGITGNSTQLTYFANFGSASSAPGTTDLTAETVPVGVNPAGSLTVAVQVQAVAAPVTPDTYTDTLTVSVQPNA